MCCATPLEDVEIDIEVESLDPNGAPEVGLFQGRVESIKRLRDTIIWLMPPCRRSWRRGWERTPVSPMLSARRCRTPLSLSLDCLQAPSAITRADRRSSKNCRPLLLSGLLDCSALRREYSSASAPRPLRCREDTSPAASRFATASRPAIEYSSSTSNLPAPEIGA